MPANTNIEVKEGTVSITDEAFKSCTSLTSITISEGVTSIGNSAFSSCSSLTSVTIPESVTSIGNSAFSNCSSLSTVTIPESVTSIGHAAFDGATWYNNLPDGVVYLGKVLYKYKGTMPANTNIEVKEGTVSITDEAFKSCTSLTSITLPESVTSIENSAFSGCSSLTSINIPEGVTSIGGGTFYGCTSLASINIPESVTSVGSSAFSGCSRLASINIPESVTSIENSAFSGCISLTSITIPKSVTLIGDGAFSRCTGELIINCNISDDDTEDSEYRKFGGSQFSRIIGEGVTSIGKYAFYECNSITSISIPQSVTSIGGDAFIRCTGDLTVNCNIPDFTFRYSGFNNVTIGEGVTSIGNFAFSDCSRLNSITIPSGVTSIKDGVFSNCKNLASISIPESVTEIREQAFYECSSLTAVSIPESVASIGQSAFYGCSSLSSLTLSNGVVSIGNHAFSECDALTSIIIPSSVTSVGYSAFSGKNIRKIFMMGSTMPSDFGSSYYSNDVAIIYTSNSDYASYNKYKVYPLLSNMFEVDGITYVPTSMSERTCDVVNYDINRTTESVEVGASVSYRNIAFTVNNVNDCTFYNSKNIKEISLSNQGGLGTNAFENCTALASVELSESITSIGNYAFNKCGQLTSITLPASIASVGYAPFAQCDNLASISVKNGNTKYDSRENCNAIIETEANKLVAACDNTVIPESVTEIGDYAFVDCAEITSLNIKDNINSIGDYAFSGCSGLTDVVIEDRTEVLTLGSNGNKGLFADCPLASVYIGGKIVYDTSSSKGYSPFYGNTSLQTVEITDREEQIYENEFYGCTNLTNVSIGNKISSIGAYAFSGCSSLKGFSFGSSMESIGAYAFTGCTNLESMTVHTVVPPVCGTQALNDIDKWKCTLNVPEGYASAYQAAGQWKEFLYVEDNVPIKKYTLTFMVDGNVYHTESLAYDEAVVLPDNPEKKGYSFVEWEGLPQTMPSTDIAVNASFAINEYTLTYVVDDEEYAKETVVYGVTIEPKAAPTKEGHTFGGWSEIPETMPATDVTIIGSFTVNSYLLTYIIDGTVYDTKSVAYGSEIVMLEAPEKTGYTFDGWDTNLSVMPAEDVVINGSYTRLPIENFILNDGDSEFILNEDLQCEKITYIRTFNNTNWQALYVPFEIPVTEEFLADFEVADLNDVRQYDRDDDGVKDETVIEAFKVKSGATLAANYPYLIRAKEVGEKTITVEDATLYATEEISIDCSSVREKFTFTGTYSRLSSEQLPQGEGYYALSGGVWQPVAADASLDAFRFYLKVDSRSGVNAAKGNAIRMRVIDENGNDEGTTGIDNSEFKNQNSELIFDLQGRRVENPTKGVYIVNGKKTIIK